jgi:GPH family glycoside/pentoside/hexuronide:cation symporter
VQPIAKEKTEVSRDLGDIVHNVPWILLFIVTILFILFVCIRLNVTTHYFKYYVGEQNVTLFGTTHKYGFEVLASAFNTVGQVLSLVGTALVPLFARVLGRKKATIILFLTSLVCTGAFYFFKPEDLVLIFVFQAIGSLAGGPISALFWIMYADTADYSEWKTGRRATGLVFSASIMSNKMGWAVGSSIAAIILDQTGFVFSASIMSNKIGWAVGSMVAAFILAQTGFVANVAQHINVLTGLKAMMSLIPVAVGAVALILLVFFYKLDEGTMAKIKTELDARRKAGEQAALTA